MTIRESADTIRTTVTSRDIAAKYGYTPNRGGYIPCPFHQEKTASLKLHKSGWYCYGCGKGGSVIDFVMAHEGYGFADAVRAIDAHMGLGLLDVKRVSLTSSIRRNQQQFCFNQVKDQFKRTIKGLISYCDGELKKWWDIYHDAYTTAPQERTGAQWDALYNAREWCMYYEDQIAVFRKQYEEVITWRMSPQNLHSA